MKGLNLKAVTGTALPLIGGAVGAKFIKNMAAKMIKNEKLRAALPLVLGLILSSSAKTQKIGHGMVAVGGADLVGTLVPGLNGIEDMDLSGIFGDPLNDNPLNDFVEGQGEISNEVGEDVSWVGAADYDTY